MDKNLPSKQQTAKIILSKTKTLMGIVDKLLLSNNGTVSIDDSWIERLWEWADTYSIPDLKSMHSEIYEWKYMGGLPRKKNKLLSLVELNMPYICRENNALPSELCNLIKLDALCLHYSSLIELPREIGKLKNLTYFDLHENFLKTLPKEIGNLTSLEHLNLGWNGITELPKEIGKLHSLKILLLSCNKLNKLPEEIINLTNLTHFTLNGNSNLILSSEQKEWILILKENKCDIDMDEDLLSRTQKKISVASNSNISYNQYNTIEFTDAYDAWEDKMTGLMWEVKTLENVRYPYVYSKEYIDNTMYSEDLIDDVQDIFSYAQKLNTMNYAGFSDWRVPSKEELETLLTENNFYENAILGRNTLNLYWTSTTLEDNPNLAYIGAFSTGSVFDLEKNAISYVRCVRGKYNDY